MIQLRINRNNITTRASQFHMYGIGTQEDVTTAIICIIGIVAISVLVQFETVSGNTNWCPSSQQQLQLPTTKTAFIRNKTRSIHKQYNHINRVYRLLQATSTQTNSNNSSNNKASPTKTMDFLKRIGKIGTHSNTTNTIGVDEGNAGSCSSSTTMQKQHPSQHSHPPPPTTATPPPSFQSCIDTGIIDDMTHPFPYTNSGTKWDIYTDQVMGGISTGSIERVVYDFDDNGQTTAITANVLSGTVRLENNGGFIQMATNFVPSLSITNNNNINSFRNAIPIDASKYTGIELQVQSDIPGIFNVHLKTSDCLRPQSSYRASFDIDTKNKWYTIRIPFTQFQGYNIIDNNPLDVTKLTRIGIVAIGRQIPHVQLAISNIKFFV